MRLLHTKLIVLEEFYGLGVPSYAILSHTWEEEEVSFKDISEGRVQGRKGYIKVLKACELASREGFEWLWIDACCIDKSSSAELTEAINSMFRWYERSQACLVYLSDLSESSPLEAQLQHCRWFTRGWTLQELIAPKNVLFFDRSWALRCTKANIINELGEITGIDSRVLLKTLPLSTIAVAQKMSWVSRRSTTRIEDMAYCLLGIFDVNMPMLYGEEEKAFHRLQEEIIKTTFDFSVFAWTMTPEAGILSNSGSRMFTGVLARSPADFANCGSMTQLPTYDRTDFSISNRGIKIHTRITLERTADRTGYRYVFPVCSSENNSMLGMRMRKWDLGAFIREDPFSLVKIQSTFLRTILRTRHLITELPAIENHSVGRALPYSALYTHRPSVIQIQLPMEMSIGGVWPWTRWDDEDQLFFTTRDSNKDWIAMKLNGYLSTFINDEKVFFPLECMFYALGWADSNRQHLQCTIIDHNKFRHEIMEISARLNDYDGDRIWFKEALVHFQIPEASSVAFHFPEYRHTAVITLTPEVGCDNHICQNPFWKILFTWSVYPDHDVPSTPNADVFNMDKGINRSDYLTYPSYAQFLR